MTHIETDLQASKSTIALVGSLLSGCYLIFGPIVSGRKKTIILQHAILLTRKFFFSFILLSSALTNRYGFRNVTILGSIISSAAFALSTFATSPIHLHILYGVFGGIGFCFIYMPSV